MIDNKMTALLGSLLLVAAALPLATAHLDGNSNAAFGAVCRGDADCHSDGVSGNYVNNPQNAYVAAAAIPPSGFISGAQALCDLEVLGDGTAYDPLDEEQVDHESTGGVGMVPDGTWDDGGIGGACHTDTQYGIAGYNTAGCPDSTSLAYAKDLVSGDDVWIGASCDTATTSGGGFSLSGCVVNELISGADPIAIAGCVVTFVNNAPAPVTSCGSDSFADSINYGKGGAGVPYSGSLCPTTVGSAAVFTFSYVNADTPEAFPATAGWINTQ